MVNDLFYPHVVGTAVTHPSSSLLRYHSYWSLLYHLTGYWPVRSRAKSIIFNRIISHLFTRKILERLYTNNIFWLINQPAYGAYVHYIDITMSTMASQITSLTVVYSTVYSDADQRKHQSSASLAFVWGIHRDRRIPRTKGQLRGKCFHLMTSSCPHAWSIFCQLFP